MPEDRGTIRQIAFREIFPWLILVRALRIATQTRLLLLSAVAVVLTITGWWLIGALFTGDEHLKDQLGAYGQLPSVTERVEITPEEARLRLEQAVVEGRTTVEIPKIRVAPHLPGPAQFTTRPPLFLEAPVGEPVSGAWWNLSAPFRQLFSAELKVTGLAFLILAGLWLNIIWSFVGGLITRLAALQIALEERGSMRNAVRYVRRRYRSYFAAPLYPLFGVLLFTVPVALLGLIGHLGAPGMLTLGILWPLFLIAGLVMTIFLLGVLFGWPLMYPTISAEGTDSFDALSRTYSYTYQRPLYYAFLALITALLGTVAWFIVSLFASFVIYLAAWAVSWGAGGVVLSSAELLEKYPTAAHLIGFWNMLVGVIAASFMYSYFYSAATIVYFLLRQEVDGTELDEVFVEEQPEKFGLPPLTPDKAGVPTVEDESSGGEGSLNGLGDAGN